MDIEDVIDRESIGLREHHLPEQELTVAVSRLRVSKRSKRPRHGFEIGLYR